MQKFSIITVTYNSAATIAHTIKSVKEQKFVDVEHIIIDGGSTDGTLDIIKMFCHSRMIIISEPDDGIYDAMNKGLSLVNGQIVGILNSDDFYVDDEILHKVANQFKLGADIVFGAIGFVDPKKLNNIVRKINVYSFKPYYLKLGWMPPHPGTFLKRHVIEKIGNYKTSYISAADYEYFIRLFLKNNFSYASMSETLVHMRVGGISSNGIKSYIRTTAEMKKALEENGYWSSRIFLYFRLPVKFLFEKILFKLRLY